MSLHTCYIIIAWCFWVVKGSILAVKPSSPECGTMIDQVKWRAIQVKCAHLEAYLSRLWAHKVRTALKPKTKMQKTEPQSHCHQNMDQMVAQVRQSAVEFNCAHLKPCSKGSRADGESTDPDVVRSRSGLPCPGGRGRTGRAAHRRSRFFICSTR